MKNKEIHNKWICAAYKEFADYGPDFSLKLLSEKANLPRTTFYYHFLSKNDLISEVLKYHSAISDQTQLELGLIKSLIPDLYEKLYQHKTSVKFQKQLLINSHIKIYNQLYHAENYKSIRTLVPHIKAYFGFTQNDEDVCKFYNTLTDAWYAKLDFSSFSVNYMISLAEEIMENILKLNQVSTTDY